MRPKEMSSFWKSLDTSEITELNRVFLTGIRDDEDLMKRDHQDRNGVRRNTKVKHTVKHAVKHTVKHAVKHTVKHAVKHAVKHTVKHAVKHTVKHAVKHKSETRMRLDMIRDVLYVSSEQ